MASSTSPSWRKGASQSVASPRRLPRSSLAAAGCLVRFLVHERVPFPGSVSGSEPEPSPAVVGQRKQRRGTALVCSSRRASPASLRRSPCSGQESKCLLALQSLQGRLAQLRRALRSPTIAKLSLQDLSVLRAAAHAQSRAPHSCGRRVALRGAAPLCWGWSGSCKWSWPGFRGFVCPPPLLRPGSVTVGSLDPDRDVSFCTATAYF